MSGTTLKEMMRDVVSGAISVSVALLLVTMSYRIYEGEMVIRQVHSHTVEKAGIFKDYPNRLDNQLGQILYDSARKSWITGDTVKDSEERIGYIYVGSQPGQWEAGGEFTWKATSDNGLEGYIIEHSDNRKIFYKIDLQN